MSRSGFQIDQQSYKLSDILAGRTSLRWRWPVSASVSIRWLLESFPDKDREAESEPNRQNAGTPSTEN